MYYGLGSGNLFYLENWWAVLEVEWLVWCLRIVSGSITEIFFMALTKIIVKIQIILLLKSNKYYTLEFT